ncbi:uncharacterized protein LOC111369408 isoform X2 [Olea europaea var. sylvestris]|nr:uncharacterized protein LOC111369408 isoform X2 [Olea europaea var. sylvestris]
MSKSVCSFDFLEAASESKQSAKTSHTKRSSLPSVSQHSVSENSDGLDLFSLPISSVQEPKKALPNISPPEPKDLLRRTRSWPL